MAVTYDRKTQGLVSLFLDGKLLTNGTLPLVASPKIGQEIWFNALNWDTLDSGFRGTLDRFTMYADALPPDAVAQPLSAASPTFSKLKASIDIPHATRSPWVILFPFFIVMLVLLLFVRRKRGLVMALPEYASRLPEYASRIPEYAHRLPEYTHRLPEYAHRVPEYAQRLPEMAKAVPGYAMDIVKRSPWMRSPATKE